MNLSRDAKRARHFFNFLSLGCDLFSFYFAWQYKKAAAAIGRIVDLSDKRVLDIGTGTGVWASFLQEKGAVVHGIDIAEKILHRAERRCRGRATFHVDDAENLTHCEDQSYDIATASFVLHGVRKEESVLYIGYLKQSSTEGIQKRPLIQDP